MRRTLRLCNFVGEEVWVEIVGDKVDGESLGGWRSWWGLRIEFIKSIATNVSSTGNYLKPAVETLRKWKEKFLTTVDFAWDQFTDAGMCKIYIFKSYSVVFKYSKGLIRSDQASDGNKMKIRRKIYSALQEVGLWLVTLSCLFYGGLNVVGVELNRASEKRKRRMRMRVSLENRKTQKEGSAKRVNDMKNK